MFTSYVFPAILHRVQRTPAQLQRVTYLFELLTPQCFLAGRQLPARCIARLSHHILKVSLVSWNYGGGKPSGEVAEKKTEGEVTVTSKKGNTIKRKGDPENPAVHIAREGNDVVKKQSELTVEEKADGEADANGAEEEEEAKTGEKRAREDDEEVEEKEAKKARGRPKGLTKATPEKKAGGTGKRGRPAQPKSEVAKAKSNEPKKPRGRPKKDEGAEAKAPKEKKEPKSKATPKKAKSTANGTGVGSRTRSNK